MSKRSEAMEKGKTTYNSYKCRKCCTTEKYTSSGSCVFCKKQRQKLLYNREFHEGEPCSFCHTTVKITETGKCKKCSETQKKQVAERMNFNWDNVIAEHKNNPSLSCQRW